MTLDDLTAEQLAAVASVVARHRDYLAKLRDRVREHQFPSDDPLLTAVNRAWQEASNVVVVASAAKSKRPVAERRPWAGYVREG